MAQNKNLAEFMRAPEWARVNDENRKVVEHHVLRGPPVKLSALARDLGLTVKSTAFANQSISGEIRLEENRSFIVRVNKFENKVRQRFTVAHEISHFLLHRHIIEEENGIRDDVLYRSDLSNKIEAEANRLAADILMPANMVLELSSQ